MECQAQVGEQALAQGTVDCAVTEVGGVLSQQHLYSTTVVPGSSVWRPAKLLSPRRKVDVRALSHFQAVGFSSRMRSLLPNTVLG